MNTFIAASLAVRSSDGYVMVKGASLDDGLLQIELERELPDAMKPRRIEVQTGKAVGKGDKVRTIEHSKVA